MRLRIVFAGLTVCCLLASPLSRGGDSPKNGSKAENDPTMAKLANMVGGTWTNNNPKFLVEFQYAWAFNKNAIRGTGAIAKGTPNETEVEAIMGWDPVKKHVYYLDVHGGTSVFNGTIKQDGDKVVFNFETLVGRPQKWRSEGTFPDQDTYAFKIFGLKQDGTWQQHVEQTLRRVPGRGAGEKK